MFDDPTLNTAQEVARKVVATHKGLFDAFPEVGDDDLVQECLSAIIRHAPTFNTAKAAWSTCAGRCAHFRLIDFHRHKVSQRKHETINLKSTAQPESVQNLSDELIHIAERAADVAEGMMPAYARTGPHRFTRHQLAACIALRHQLKTSFRGVVFVLENRGDICERIGLRRVPTFRTLAYAESAIRMKIRQLRKERHEQSSGTHIDSENGGRRAVDEYAPEEPLRHGATCGVA